MAVSMKSVFFFFLIATAFISMAAASDRQPLFSEHYSSSRQLPMRFQEMIQRRKLAQSGSYGTPKPTYKATPAPTYKATPAPPRTTTVVTPVKYGTYGIYGR